MVNKMYRSYEYIDSRKRLIKTELNIRFKGE